MLSIDNHVVSVKDITQSFSIFESASYLKPGNCRVAVCLKNVKDWLALCFFAKEKGLTVMPIHASTPLSLAKKYALKAGCTSLLYTTLDNVIALSDAPIKDESPGLIQMSSGTTGEPKCITRSWRSIDREVNAYVSQFTAPNSMSPVIACPVTHSYGLICGVFVGLARGKHPRIFTNTNPKHLLMALLKLKSPLLYSSPPMIDTITMLWPKSSNLHAVMTSGTLISTPVYDRAKRKVNHFFQQYGCSEVGCIAVGELTDDVSVVGCVLPHLHAIAGTDVNHGDEIKVIVREPFSGENQSVATNDLGFIKNVGEKQVLHFVSRMDDTIVVAGMNVYPKDVEDVVLSHPDIKDAVLFKVKDNQAGHRAYLQFCAEYDFSDDDLHALKMWCHENLASYQVPFRFKQVGNIERLANGKVNRKEIAKQYDSACSQRIEVEA